MRTLGIDYGEKRIGLAISDPMGFTAQGLPTINRVNTQDYLKELADIIRENNVNKIVVGLPKNMNDTLGKKAEEVLEFVEVLKSNLNLTVYTVDERLTTVRAHKAMSGTKMSRKKKQAKVDMISAQLILQSYLDKLAPLDH
ncbi:MAG: Holliday junction resolvase RuvX [Candidatus Scalinduaceae bacterium]